MTGDTEMRTQLKETQIANGELERKTHANEHAFLYDKLSADLLATHQHMITG